MLATWFRSTALLAELFKKRLFISSEYQFNTFERIGKVFDTSFRLLLIGNTKKTEFKKNRESNKQKTDDTRKVSKKVQTVS